ncbi:hypothetical protein GAPWKB11_0022 [Gilliamella apicola]|nr:hypothetical protein GAPWKB11_0022 [Gilliamella apicola]
MIFHFNFRNNWVSKYAHISFIYNYLSAVNQLKKMVTMMFQLELFTPL